MSGPSSYALAVTGVVLLFGALLLFGGASVHAHETSGSSWGNATAIAALLGAAACLVTGVGCFVAATRRRS